MPSAHENLSRSYLSFDGMFLVLAERATNDILPGSLTRLFICRLPRSQALEDLIETRRSWGVENMIVQYRRCQSASTPFKEKRTLWNLSDNHLLRVEGYHGSIDPDPKHTELINIFHDRARPEISTA